MYIEDLIDSLLFSNISLSPYDSKVLNSFNNQIFGGTGLTEKQSLLAIRTINRYATQLSGKLNVNVHSLTENPQFKFKLRKTVNEKSVRVIDNTSIVARFPYDDNAVQEIRKYKSRLAKSDNIMWDKEQMAWIFPLNEENIQFVMGLCNSPAFEFDDDFTKYTNDSDDILNNIEKYAPMLAIDNGELKILNSPKNMPEINTDNILEALFLARRYGVNLWTDDIDTYLNGDDFNPKVREFLRSVDHTNFHLSTDETGISCLETIVKYLSPLIVVVPGGMEFDKLVQSYTLFNGMGVSNENMSVLFRLPTETGRNFNEFVRNQGLNAPISDKTKIVYISGKLPKPLIKSKIHFNGILSLGSENAHYTLKTYVQNHPNLVYFNVKKNQKGFPIAKL